MTISFSIQASVLEALQQFCLKPTSALGHPILHNILFEITPDAVRLVATDGYCLGIVHLTATSGFGFELHTCEVPTTFVLPLEDVAPILRLRKQSVMFTLDDAIVTLQAGGTCLTVSQRPGEDYPNYRRVLPECHDAPISRIALDTALLARFTTFAKILKEEPFFDLAFTHQNGPVGVRLKSVSSFYGVLMPRVLAHGEGMPTWLRPVSEAPLDLPAQAESVERIIRLHDLDGIDTFTGTDDDGCVWMQFVVDALAAQEPWTCVICGEAITYGWHCLDGGEDVCNGHVTLPVRELAEEEVTTNTEAITAEAVPA